MVECGYCFLYYWISVQVVCRWCETYGIEYFDAYNAVILDEIGSVERNVEYSFLFELMLAMQRRHEEWPEPFFDSDVCCYGE